MINKNQIVQIKWTKPNRKRFEELGYQFSEYNDTLTVAVNDLNPKDHVRVNIICDDCGTEYTKEYRYVNERRGLYGKDLCPKCTRKNKLDITGVIKCFMDEKSYISITKIDESIKGNDVIQYMCPKHNLKQSKAYNLMLGYGCPDCGNEHRGISNKLSADEIISRIELTGESILLNPDDYKDVFTRNLRFLCKCGNEFTTSFANYTKHDINRCPVCSQKESRGELLIRGYLEDNNINFKQEKRFADCRDSRSLPFDFFLPDHNKIIEFDGKHHYSPVFSDEQHLQTVKHDKIKNNYCKQNGIELLRIPYWEGDHIPELLSQFI